MNPSEEVPYRSPVSTLPERDTASSVDEGNFDTLKAVRQDLAQAIADLSKDFNAFNILKEDSPDEAAKKLLHEIEVKQGVYDIVMPLLDAVTSSMAAVDAKYKER